jgi:hypothetical protein
MKATIWKVAALVVAAAALWFGWAAWRAHRNLVTLHVRNADLREVVKKIEWQTWELIVVQSNVNGRVTLNCDDVPLEEVLGIIGEQVEARWSALYPLYSSSKSLKNFKRVLRGEAEAAQSGWTNYARRGFGGFRGGPGGPGGGMFGDTARSENNLVSANLVGKELSVATMALARFSQAQVVPEDGTEGVVNQQLDRVPFDDAVARVAHDVRRSWTKYYAIQGGGFGGRGGMAGFGGPRGDRGPRGEDGPPPEVAFFARGDSTNVSTNDLVSTNAFNREERRTNFQRMMEAQLETMTSEQRARVEEIRNMTPEQRRAQFQGAGMENRMSERMARGLKNSTPEQRVQRDQRRLEMQKRFQQGGGGPGGGGRGR